MKVGECPEMGLPPAVVAPRNLHQLKGLRHYHDVIIVTPLSQRSSCRDVRVRLQIA